MVIDREYRAGEKVVLHPGEKLVVDFGQNCAAVPAFTFNAAAGTVLTCLPSELMNDGNGPAFGFFTVGAYVRIED